MNFGPGSQDISADHADSRHARRQMKIFHMSPQLGKFMKILDISDYQLPYQICLDLFQQRAAFLLRPCRPLGPSGMAQMLRTLDPQWRMASSLGSTLASILDEIQEVN